MNNKFSKFATIYEDREIQESEDINNPNEEDNPEETEESKKSEKEIDNTKSPKTGDSITIWFVVMGISIIMIIIIIAVSIHNKKRAQKFIKKNKKD